MKNPHPAALIALIIAMLLILGFGAFRASMHNDPTPESAPASAASTEP